MAKNYTVTQDPRELTQVSSYTTTETNALDMTGKNGTFIVFDSTTQTLKTWNGTAWV